MAKLPTFACLNITIAMSTGTPNAALETILDLSPLDGVAKAALRTRQDV